MILVDAVGTTKRWLNGYFSKNVSFLMVSLWGGGGGAGAVIGADSSSSNDLTGSFGGGAGGYATCYINVTAGMHISIIV